MPDPCMLYPLVARSNRRADQVTIPKKTAKLIAITAS